MTKWIILGMVIYLLIGFSTCLVIQIHDSNQHDLFGRWLFNGGEPTVEIIAATLGWWIIWIGGIFLILLPTILKGLYKLFVLIVFGIAALFAK